MTTIVGGPWPRTIRTGTIPRPGDRSCRPYPESPDHGIPIVPAGELPHRPAQRGEPRQSNQIGDSPCSGQRQQSPPVSDPHHDGNQGDRCDEQPHGEPTLSRERAPLDDRWAALIPPAGGPTVPTGGEVTSRRIPAAPRATGTNRRDHLRRPCRGAGTGSTILSERTDAYPLPERVAAVAARGRVAHGPASSSAHG